MEKVIKMNGIRLNINCDWCGGEVEHFPNAKSGLRCTRCWRTEGKNDGECHIITKDNPEHYTNRKEVKQ